MNNSPFDTQDSWTDSDAEDLLALEQEADWRACSKDPRYFCTRFVRTKDQLDRENPYKPLPDIPYLWWFLDFLMVEPLVAVPKSRRVLATWLITALDVWECLFLEARTIGLGNEDFSKAKQNLEMHRTIYDQLPEWMKTRAPMKWKDDKMSFLSPASEGDREAPRTRCEIIAFEQGTNVFNMYTFSRVWIDEAQKQRYPAEMYLSAQPTIKGRDPTKRGQLVYTGTPAQGWFELLCHDQLERESPPPPVWERQLVSDWKPAWWPPKEGEKEHPWGVVVRKLHDSGFIVVQIHYTADPEKRTPEWYAFAKKGIPDEDWNQDYECNWKAKAGRPAIPQMGHSKASRRHEIVVPFFEPPAFWVRFSTHDYGVTNPYSCHFHAISPAGIGYTYWEHYGVGPLGSHLDAIKAHKDFAQLRLSILDRSCWAQTQQSTETLEGRATHQTRSVEQLHQAHGVYCIPAAVVRDGVKIARIEEVWPKSDDVEMELVNGVYQKTDRVKPIRWFVMDNCPHLLRECEGIVWEKLSYSQKLKKNDPEKLVDKDNHAFDEFTYGLLHMASPELEVVHHAMTPQQVRDEYRFAMQQENFRQIEAEQEQAERQDDDGWLDD